MGIANKFALTLGSTILLSANAWAENIAMNTAQMQTLDKITGTVSVINVPVNGEVKFGSFSVVVRNCQTTPPEETPENYAFVDIADTLKNGKTYNIFKGWMVSSSPSLNSVEHPIYDVWLLKCINTQINTSTILTTEELNTRDKLEKFSEDTLSKEAKIALEVQEEQARQAEIAKEEQAEQERLLAEEKEAKLRKAEIDKEIQIQQQKTDAELNEMAGDEASSEEGPVSLLNIGAQNTSAPINEVEPISEILVPEIETPQKSSFEQDNEFIADTDTVEGIENTVDGLVIIEDVHHETIDDKLNLPQDIEDIMPVINNKPTIE